MRNRVLLHRFHSCSTCGAAPNPCTQQLRNGIGRTTTRYQHLGYCRVGIAVALTAGPRSASFEPAPIGDRKSGAR